jgi:hypothetical protein
VPTNATGRPIIVDFPGANGGGNRTIITPAIAQPTSEQPATPPPNPPEEPKP